MKTKLLTTAIAFILGMGIQQNAHADLKDGLVAHWSFDDCRATDNSGNGHDGTLNGNPQCVDGVKGKAFSFDGVQDFIQVNDESMAFSPNDLTISVWINPNSNQVDFAGIVDKSHSVNGSVGGWVLQGTNNYKPSFYFGYCDSTGQCSARYGEDLHATTTANNWTHVVFTKKGNVTTGYQNGKIISVMEGSISDYTKTNRQLLIGAVNGWNRYFNGLIDDASIYNRALTEAEVLELYNGGGVVAEKPVLVADTGNNGTCSATKTAAMQIGGNSGTVTSSAASCVTTGNTLANLVDLEKSSIDYDNGKIKVVLKNVPEPVSVFNTASIYNVKLTIGDSKPVSFNPTSKEFSFDFSPKSVGSNQQDKLIKLDFYRGVLIQSNDKWNTSEIPVGTLYGVVDNIRLAHGKGNQAILASRTLSQTKPHSDIECKTIQGIQSECNNFFATDEIAAEGSTNATFQDTLTHRIVDFDKLVSRVAINNTWAKSPYGKKPQGDNNRIPLLLIHGWQGGGLTENPFRNPAKLGLWEYSELHYWQHFLDYYLTSPALQKKYHLYSYHYPSYKHVTYNASVLNDLLQEVGKTSPASDLGRAMTTSADNVPQNNLTIVAHSMGGMVARSLIEEYEGLGDSKVYGASMNKLNKLITLDTPHHGSTASDQSSTLAKIPKDMLTQGAADLNWDNYDNQLQNDVVSNINENYRWVSAEINNQEFDSKFCNAIDCNNTANPWLLNMNKNFERLTNSAKDKYVIYAAWMSNTVSEKNDSLNPIDNGSTYNFAEKIGIPDLPNGVAEPVTSALLSSFDPKTNTTLPFQPQCKNSFPVWFDSTIKKPTLADDFYSWQLYEESLLPEVAAFPNVCGITDTLSLERANFLKLHSILIPIESVLNLYAHPYGLPYRIFWDYDHEKMVNGAYSGDLGIWDQFVLSKKFDTTVANKVSAFVSNSLRNNYIYAASKFRDKKSFSISKNQVYDPLRAEPLYLILEGDLLKK